MLEVRDLSAVQGGRRLFEGVSFRLPAGGRAGISGPSGAGKTTLGRVLAGLHPAESGEIRLDGAAVPPGAIRYLHQTPLAAMNPRWRIARVLAEPGGDWQSLAPALGLEAAWLERFPHELSGGQLQRVSLARALAAGPRVLIADEISAPLDPLAQRGLWQALCAIAAERGIGLIVISHEAALLAQLCPGQIHSLG